MIEGWNLKSPVVQDGDDLSWLESELVVLSGFKVIDGADLPAIGLVRGQQAWGAGVEAGQGGLWLLTLLLQRELNSCARRHEKSKNHKIIIMIANSCRLRIWFWWWKQQTTWTKTLYLWPNLPPLFCWLRWKDPLPPKLGLLWPALQPW